MTNNPKIPGCNRLAELFSATVWACTLAMLLSDPAQGGMANPSTVNFGNVPINTTVTRNVAITIDAGYYIANASGAGTSAPFGFNYGTCIGVGGFTGPGTCTAIASFDPTIVGIVAEVINILECPVGGGFCGTITFNVLGMGVSVAAANPPLVDFGSLPINTTATRSVTITVDAGHQISFTTGGINPPFGFTFGTCFTTIGFTGPGNCTVNESFSPTSPGAVSGTTMLAECPIHVACIQIPFNVKGTGVLVGAPVIHSSASRKVHGAAGTFDLPLSP